MGDNKTAMVRLIKSRHSKFQGDKANRTLRERQHHPFVLIVPMRRRTLEFANKITLNGPMMVREIIEGQTDKLLPSGMRSIFRDT